MRTIASSVAGLALAAAVAVAVQAAPPPPAQQALPQATLDATRQFEFVSAVNRSTYRVQVFLPRGTAPAAGFPVLYLLDGNALFGTFAGAMRNRAMASEIAPALVVGISGGPDADRTFDFTATDMTAREKEIVKDLGPDPRFGGADDFLRVIREEVVPRVAALAPVDGHREALFGWSLGGLFVTHAMFEHPDAFRTWLALSPSLWRSERSTLAAVPAFRDRLARGRFHPRYFLGVGSREEQAPPGLRLDGMTPSELAAELRYCRMVGNAADLAGLLGPAARHGELELSFKVFQGDTHNSVPWSAVNRVLDFAFPR